VNIPLLLALPLCALLAAPTPPPTLTLKDGRTFQLRMPAHFEGGRVTFTTTEGKTYSLSASDVRSEVDRPPTPTRTPKVYNPMDSQNLGAIARQQRAETGKTTDLSAPHPTVHPHPTTRTPRAGTKGSAAKGTPKAPRATRTPTPAAH
jgi:hypothetical protein